MPTDQQKEIELLTNATYDLLQHAVKNDSINCML